MCNNSVTVNYYAYKQYQINLINSHIVLTFEPHLNSQQNMVSFITAP